MIFPNHFTQTQEATAALETMAMNLENAAEALRAVLAGNAQDYHMSAIGEHMTSDSYGLSFLGFGHVRCPSCGAIDWTCGKADKAEGFCPTCQEHNDNNKFCRSCETWFPNAEFEHPFYCQQSEGMESETADACRECLREQNEQDDHERRLAATADYSKL